MQPERVLAHDLAQSLGAAEKALGIVISVDKSRVLAGLGLLGGPS